MFKRIFTAILLIVTFSVLADNGLPTPDKTTEQLDSVVAVVNNELITQNEFNQAMTFTKQQIQQSGASMPDEKTLKTQVLNGLIDRALQLQLAQQNKLSVSDKDVNQQILSIAQHNNTDLAGLKSQLAASNLSYPAFVKRIREQMLIQQIQQSVVAGNIAVTANDIKKFRADHANDIANAEYDVGDILIPIANINDKAAVNAAHSRALALIQDIDSGTSRSAAITKYNATYNDLGWRSLNDLPSLFTKPIAATQKGGFTSPLLAPNGYHVLIVLDKRGSADQMSDDQIRNLVAQQQADQKIQSWLADIHKTAYIKISPDYQ